MAKTNKTPYLLTKFGVAAAVIGGLVKVSFLASTLPDYFDSISNAVLFLSVVLIAFDIARGG